MKKTIMFFVFLLLSILRAGCIGDNTKNMKQQAKLSDVLKLNGSTTLCQIANTAAEEFMKLHSGVKIDMQHKSAKTHLSGFSVSV